MTRDGGPSINGLDPRAVTAAVRDALAEHEAWLCDWQRAMVCGLAPGDEVIGKAAHRTCRFGQWIERNGSGLGRNTPLGKLGDAHREMHEAARRAASSRGTDEPVGCTEYDAVMAAADSFRSAARRIIDARGEPEGETAPGDTLNELKGRLTMLGELERERDRALRTGTALSLMMVRPEGTEELERIHGRAGLDRVIAGIAARLFGLLRPYDGIFRHGMNDFVVCLPGTTSGQAAGVARRLLEVISGASVILRDDTELSIRASFGIAAIDSRRPVQETLEHAVRAADMASARSAEPVVVWTPDREN